MRVIVKAEVSGSCRSSAVRLHKVCEKFNARVRSYDPSTGTYRVTVSLQYEGSSAEVRRELLAALRSLSSVSDECLAVVRVVIPTGALEGGTATQGCPARARKALRRVPSAACVDFSGEYRCVRACEGLQRRVIAICRRRAITLLSAFGDIWNFSEVPIVCAADELLKSTLDVLLRFAEDLHKSYGGE